MRIVGLPGLFLRCEASHPIPESCSEEILSKETWFFLPSPSVPKERRRRRAEKRLSKRVFLESLLCPLKVCSENT